MKSLHAVVFMQIFTCSCFHAFMPDEVVFMQSLHAALFVGINNAPVLKL